MKDLYKERVLLIFYIYIVVKNMLKTLILIYYI